MGEVAGEEVVEAIGDEGGVGRRAVERREEAMQRRICDSVERVRVVMHAVISLR